MAHELSLTDSDIRSLGEGELVVRDGMLSESQVFACAADLDQLRGSKRLTPAGMGRGAVRVQTDRGDRTIWAQDVDASLFVGLGALFEDVRTQLNEGAWLGLDRFDVQLATFEGDGARYVQHLDALAGDRRRRATAIVYLNPGWVPADGGCLRIDPPSGRRDVEPLGGRLVIFLSDRLRHEVLPCHALRRAATAWYCG